MSPLGAVCAGLLLVVLDLRVPGVDVLPDVLGWVVVVLGLSRLLLPGPLVLRTRTAALVCAVLSVADLSLPVATESSGLADGGPVISTTVTAAPQGVQAVLVSGYSLAFSVALVLLSLALRTRAAQAGDAAAATLLARFAVFHAAVGVLDLVVELVTRAAGLTAPRSVDGGAGALVLVAVVVTLAVAVWFVVTLFRMRDRPWAAAGQVSPAAPA